MWHNIYLVVLYDASTTNGHIAHIKMIKIIYSLNKIVLSTYHYIIIKQFLELIAKLNCLEIKSPIFSSFEFDHAFTKREQPNLQTMANQSDRTDKICGSLPLTRHTLFLSVDSRPFYGLGQYYSGRFFSFP